MRFSLWFVRENKVWIRNWDTLEKRANHSKKKRSCEDDCGKWQDKIYQSCPRWSARDLDRTGGHERQRDWPRIILQVSLSVHTYHNSTLMTDHVRLESCGDRELQLIATAATLLDLRIETPSHRLQLKLFTLLFCCCHPLHCSSWQHSTCFVQSHSTAYLRKRIGDPIYHPCRTYSPKECLWQL